MYLTHPVRRLREEPVAGETVTLLVRADDGVDLDRLAERLAAHGTVEDRLRFGTLRVTVPQDALDAVCALEGIAAIETANTLALDPDGAGEDVELDGD